MSIFDEMLGKNAEDIRRLLASFSHYLKHYKDGKFIEIIDGFQDKYHRELWEKFKAIFMKLQREIEGYVSYNIFVIKNGTGSYDIFVALDNVENLNNDISYENVINQIANQQVPALVVECVDRDNAARFIKSFYILNRFREEQSKQFSQNKYHRETESISFRNVVSGSVSTPPQQNKVVYYEREIIPYSMKNLELSECKSSSYAEILDAVYENRYYGTKIRKLK
ncbi:MAG: hypothetical protein J1F35_07435 [Erysipelotrichales bacterium]|nr:hypothetical protein [Erysipelotrichales bacterium]